MPDFTNNKLNAYIVTLGYSKSRSQQISKLKKKVNSRLDRSV